MNILSEMFNAKEKADQDLLNDQCSPSFEELKKQYHTMDALEFMEKSIETAEYINLKGGCNGSN